MSERKAPQADNRDTERRAVFEGEDPFATIERWLGEATASELNDPNAMSLATADADGLPDVRMVLLKEVEPAGSQPDGRGAFVFYSNYESAKGQELAENPQAAILLHWKSLRRQIRARGRVEKVAAEMSDAYYATRPLQSRLGAIASKQSRPLSSRAALMADVAALALRHPLGPSRPAHWGGYRIVPSQIEFWADGAFRLHDRFRWTWTGERWETQRLCP